MRPWLAAAMLLVASHSPVASRPAGQTFKSSVEVVRLDVLVADRGVPVRGLRASDFEVRDNGVVQQVDLVSFERAPVHVVMVLDHSASVQGEQLEDLRRAGRALIGGLRAEDKAALLTFSHLVSKRIGLTTNLRDVVEALETARPAGDTSLVDAVYSGMFLGESEGGRALVVVFSDGIDVSSWLAPKRVLDAALRVDAVVYGVSMRGSRPRFLEDVTSATGGRLLDVESKNLSQTFVSVLNEFRDRYVLSYTPTGVARGGYHRLDVRVKGRRANVKARPGYQ